MEEQSQQTTTIFDNKTEQQLQEEQKLNHQLESRQGWYKAGFFILLLILIFSLTGNAYLFYYMTQQDANAEKGIVKQPNNGLMPPQDSTPVTTGSASPAPTNSEAGTTFTGETKEFTSQAYGFRMLYPANWEVVEGTSQLFQQGDVVMVKFVGATQSEGTEFYDAAFFAVGKPLETEKTAEEWVRERYKDSVDPSRPAEFSKETIGAITYDKAYVCGLGCFQYYHTKKGNMIYSFVEFAEGPDEQKPTYEQQVRSVVESFQFTSQ